MKRYLQHVLALFSIVALWFTLYLLLTADEKKEKKHNRESFFLQPELKDSIKGGRATTFIPGYLFPSSPVADSDAGAARPPRKLLTE